MLYHKLHWGDKRGGAEFLMGGAPSLPFEPPLERNGRETTGVWRYSNPHSSSLIFAGFAKKK